MCRNIKILYNVDPPATEEEVRAAALQYVRKISGLGKPPAADQAAFVRAVDEVAAASKRLLDALTSGAPSQEPEPEEQRHRPYIEEPPSFGSGA